MIKKIGIESSSIMPLIETTPRTLPLQENIKEVTNEHDVEFYTDLYSVKEAIQQINTSFTNAIQSIKKAKIVAERQSINDAELLSIIFVKSLSENWYGREETLRWSDVVINNDIQKSQNYEEFFKILKQLLDNKKEKYASMLKIKKDYLNIDSEGIQSYWITPQFITDLRIKIKVIPNKFSIEYFFQKLQSVINNAYMGKLKVNDVVDIYHIHSLYHDACVPEVWSCNQQFVKRHKKYLKSVDEFKSLFDSKIMTIRRIK